VVVLLERDGEEPTSHDLSNGDRDTTNNLMELTAVIKALEALPSGSSATVITDSTYEPIQCRFVLLYLKLTGILAGVVEELREPFHHVADAGMP